PFSPRRECVWRSTQRGLRPHPVRLLAAAFAVCLLPCLSAVAADPVPQNDLLNATLWVSNAVEYKANSVGAYALARMRLDEALADKSWTATGQSGDYQNL